MEKLNESGPSGSVPKIMPLELLKQITNNFSEEQKLGSGTFGKVYKGVHSGGEIAVKMLHLMPGHDDREQFTREFENLRRLRHQNTVQLLGYCYEIKMEYVERSDGRTVFAENIYRALCFQYMHKGSLRKHLCDECRGLDWQTRYKIIKGTCEGLKYLHEGLENPIYHLDLKPDNILLDKDMVPKLADFGLSKLVSNYHTRSTQSYLGTMGYLPPEYIERNLVSNKYDIFSLGVVMIQIISGENGYHQSADMSPQEFINLVLKNWRNRLEETPSCMSLEAECHQVKITIEIALDCIHADRKKRPDIGDIINWLNETEQMQVKMVLDVYPLVLDVYPLDIWFPFESNKVIKCPMTLTNRTNNVIGVLVLPTSLDACWNPGYPYVWEWDKRYGGRESSSIFSSRVGPHSSQTIYMTMRKQEQAPLKAAEKGTFDVLMVAAKSVNDLKILDSHWMYKPEAFEDILRGAKKSGLVVPQAKLRAAVTSDPARWQEVIAHEFIQGRTDEWIYCMDVHPTKTWLLLGHDKHVSIWNYETQLERVTKFEVKCLGSDRFKYIYRIAAIIFIAEEQWLAAGDGYGRVHVYEYSSFGTEKDKVKEFNACGVDCLVDGLAVYPKHTLLLTACRKDKVKLWDWSQGWTCTRVIDTSCSRFNSFKAGPRDASSFAAATDDHQVKVWDIHSPDPIATFEERNPTFGTDGDRDILATTGFSEVTEVCAAFTFVLGQASNISYSYYLTMEGSISFPPPNFKFFHSTKRHIFGIQNIGKQNN